MAALPFYLGVLMEDSQIGTVIVAGSSMLPRERQKSGIYFSAQQVGSILNCRKTEDELVEMRIRNNPQNEPVGHHTGRCAYCGSKDLWDDNLAYGCNDCHALLGGN